jgi:hypothetical protein
MRTLQLTHEQIEIIENALQTAEAAYNFWRKNTINPKKYSDQARGQQYFDEANKISKLSNLIKSGELDV